MFMMNATEHVQKNSFKYCIALLCIVVLVLSTKGITDESVVSLQGDMPKYLMNGAYFYDLIHDLSFTDPFSYAYQYYARYPSLSLGHHPLFLGVAETPFYAIFGVSVFSARVTIVFFMLIAATTWFLLVRSIYNETVALLSSLLFITTPFIVEFSRIVMSEIPTLALIIVSTYLFYQYCELSDKKKYAYASATCLAISIYSKHVAVFIIPVFLLYLFTRKGFRGLIQKEVIISFMLTGLLVLPLWPITIKFSQYNISTVNETSLYYKFVMSLYNLRGIWDYHLMLPVVILSFISIPISIYQKDKQVILFLYWILCCYLLISYLGITRPRDTIYWVPAFSLLAAKTIIFLPYRTWKRTVFVSLLIIIGYQFLFSLQAEPSYADGYEQAARYVVENRKGESVLYSGANDTGYFIFFVRKHDPNQDLIVLRADKVLATSKMRHIVEERITKREDIYEILKNFGVAYVVIEDIETESRALEWLRDVVKSPRFILRKEIALRTSNYRLNNIPLAIYEYKEYTPPSEGAMLDMNIPLMGGSIKVLFNDLLQKN